MREAVAIDDIFIKAVELTDPIERERYLATVCADDAGLRRQVEKLLSLSPRLGNFLESPAITPRAGETLPIGKLELDLSGETLGQYRLIRLAGKGGMGTVYLAEQEQPIRRQVAIKVLRNGLMSTRMLARFEHERQSLELMDHPNIARVLDAGMTSTGEPFIVMEWVEGVPIDAFCDQEAYSLSQRVKLLVTVCEAVQHAHQKGIIHRDLKPSNVMVTVRDGTPIPKIIDFGVAKASEPEQPAGNSLTEAGQIIGTMEYMAPEQAESANLDVDTRADVYALGALLYELLAGSPPMRTERFVQAKLSERLRLIRDVEAERPSDRIAKSPKAAEIAAKRQLGATQLGRFLANELDWISLKCLEKDRARRYETPNALAQDLERFLTCQPVLAGPPTLAYRFKKFSARNRLALAVTSLLGLVLCAAAGIGTWQAIRLSRLHSQAQVNLKSAQNNLDLAISAVDQFCTKVSEDLRLKRQDLRPLRKDLLSLAVEFQQQLVELRNRSGAARIDLAQAYFRLGKLSQEIEAHVRAAALLRLAVNEFQTLADNMEASNEIPFELGKCLRLLAASLYQSGEPAEAKLAASQAVEIFDELVRAEPDSREKRSALADIRSLQSYYARSAGEFDQSEVYAKMAIDEWGALAAAIPDDSVVLSNWAYANCQLGKAIFFRNTTRWREAEILLLEALAIAQKATSFENTTGDCHARLAEILKLLGQINKTAGRVPEAIKFLSESLATLEGVHQREPSVRSHTINLAVTFSEIAKIYRVDSKPDEARESLVKAIDLLNPLLADGINDLGTESSLADATHCLGKLKLDQGDLTGAEPLIDRAIELVEASLQHSPNDRFLVYQLPIMLENRAILRTRQGRLEDALKDYDRVVEAEAGTMRAPTRIARGNVLLQLGDHKRAVTAVQEVLDQMPTNTPSQIRINAFTSAAKVFAQSVTIAQSDVQLSELEQTNLVEKYAVGAVNCLHSAIQSGFADLDSLPKIPELESLYNREDFKALCK